MILLISLLVCIGVIGRYMCLDSGEIFLFYNTGEEIKCGMAETCYENINLRPPEVGALLREE
jgi:hypothetical protein